MCSVVAIMITAMMAALYFLFLNNCLRVFHLLTTTSPLDLHLLSISLNSLRLPRHLHTLHFHLHTLLFHHLLLPTKLLATFNSFRFAMGTVNTTLINLKQMNGFRTH